MVLDVASGYSDRQSSRPLAPDSVFAVMSLTKVMTACALLRRIELGELGFLTPVAEVIPEFSARGKGQITVGQLLTHTGGMGLGPAPLPVERLGILSETVAAICRLPPEFPPGERVSYSATTAFTILGEVLCRVDGGERSFRQILHEDLFAPLGMTDTAIGLPERLAARRVPVVVRDLDAPELNPGAMAVREKATDETTEMPAGGAYSTGADIFRLAEMLRNQGALGSARILSPAMVSLMTSNHTGLQPNNLIPTWQLGLPASPAYLGLGIFLRGEGIFPTFFASMASPDTFGGFGLGSMAFWVDPKREITFVALTSGLMGRVSSLRRFQTLGDMAISALIAA
jgi:CubicO group peptidase (beta-lactamase class C family)